MTSRPIPTEEDWIHDPGDLDVAFAKRNFCGKSYEEAVAMFIAQASDYTEDLCNMPRSCFEFYLPAYLEYLMSEHSEGDCDGASQFFAVVELRAEDICRAPKDIRVQVEEALLRVGANQWWYDAVPSIYGDFQKKAKSAWNAIAR